MIITSTKNSNDSAQTITVTTPAAAAAGKDLYLFFCCDNSGGTITPPTGVTSTPVSPVGGNATVACWKIALAGAADADYTASTTAAAGNIGMAIVCVDGEGGSFVSDTVVTRATGTGTTATSGTATNAGDVSTLLAAFDFDANATISTPPATMTLQQHVDMNSSELAVYSEVGFSTGTRALVWSTTEDWSVYGIVARWTAAPGGLAIPIAAHNYAQNG
jgi:hypothetical protein